MVDFLASAHASTSSSFLYSVLRSVSRNVLVVTRLLMVLLCVTVRVLGSTVQFHKREAQLSDWIEKKHEDKPNHFFSCLLVPFVTYVCSIFVLDEWRYNESETLIAQTAPPMLTKNDIQDTLQIICYKTLYSLYHFCLEIVMQPWWISYSSSFIHRVLDYVYVYMFVCVPIMWSKIQCNKVKYSHTLCSFHSVRPCLTIVGFFSYFSHFLFCFRVFEFVCVCMFFFRFCYLGGNNRLLIFE